MSFSSTRWPSRAPCSTSREPPRRRSRSPAGGRSTPRRPRRSASSSSPACGGSPTHSRSTTCPPCCRQFSACSPRLTGCWSCGARGIGRGVAFVLVAGLAVTFLEELTPRAMGVTAAVGAAGIAVPQAARLLRDRDRSAAGASIGTWALVAFNALVWLVYGVLVGHPLLGAAGLLQLPCSMIVIYYALRGRGEPQPRESLGRGRGDPRAGLGRSLTSGRWRAPWSIDRRGASRSPRARGARAVSERRMRPGARLPRAPVEFFPVP